MEASAHVESRWPWGILGVGVILLLTLVLLWIPSALAQGSEALRDPANIVAPLLLLVYFALGRRMIGNAAAIVAAALLAISTPFVDATLGRHPILFAETLALAGIAWLIGIEAKHREVGLTGGSALEASVAGALFGAGLTIHPATFPTALAAIVLWFFLGLRRSRATTFPSRSPSSSIAWGIFGCIAIGLAGVASIVALAAWTGTPIAFPATLAWSSAPEPIWNEAYRWMVSPFRVTDVLVLAAIAIVALIVSIESWTGSSWRGAGLLPWIYLLLYVLVGADSPFGFFPVVSESSRLPAPIPPLFVLGLGWLVLRGLAPGRVRRQEYTFLLVWLALAALLFPHAVASEATIGGSTEKDAVSVTALTILPMVVLVAGRAARAFWETERGVLARVGILAFVCLPVITALSSSVSNLGRTGEGATFAIALDRWLPLALGIAASLGALSVLITVRPDPSIEEAPRGGERRPRFRGHHRRRGGRGRPHRGRPPRRAR